MVFAFLDGSIPTQCCDNFIKIFTVPTIMDNNVNDHYSRGQPSPTLSCTKYSTNGDGEKFYTLDPPQLWNPKSMDHYVYKDPVQFMVRTILDRSFIIFFNTLEYKKDPITL